MMNLKVVLYPLCVLGFFAYCGWMISPYLSSVLVRDASVTVWLESSIAPIDGKLSGNLPRAGSIIGADNLVTDIENDLLLDENQSVESVREKVWSARLNRDQAKEFLGKLNILEQERLTHQQDSIEIYLAEIDAHLRGLEMESLINTGRIEVLQRIVDRQKQLLERRTGSQAKLDEAIVPLGELQLRQTQIRADLRKIKMRKNAANRGVYLQANGDVPNWVRRNELVLQLELQKAHRNLHGLELIFKERLKDLMESQKTLDKLSNAQVTAPEGSTVFRVLVSPHATVSAGDRIIEWGNCSLLLIDAPVSDVELPFIKSDSEAIVYLEGEDFPRKARVLLTRGSSATLGPDQLGSHGQRARRRRRTGSANVGRQWIGLFRMSGRSSCTCGFCRYRHN